MGRPDWKPDGPLRIRGELARLHRAHAVDGECLLCGVSTGLSLHHVYDRSDVWRNLVFVCGSGTTGCHGLITANDPRALTLLGIELRRRRRDVIGYVLERAGIEAGRDWLRRRLRLYLSVEEAIEIGGSHGTQAEG